MYTRAAVAVRGIGALKKEETIYFTAMLRSPYSRTPKIDARIRRLFPFTFTAGQDRAAREISSDLASGVTSEITYVDGGFSHSAVAIEG